MKNHIKLLIIMLFLVFPAIAFAIPEFADETGKPCNTCHVGNESDRNFTEAGKYFLTNKTLPLEIEKQDWKPILRLDHNLRLLIGYLHVLVGIIWFGAIFYIHIIVRPQKLRRGIPKEERLLGLISLLTVGITGTLLTLNRVKGWGDFTASTFGMALSMKIIFYLIMVSLALVAITFIHRKLSMDVSNSIKDEHTLESFDGQGSKPSYVSVGDKVYDLTVSKLWPEGLHMRRHQAGRDLTKEIEEDSPHGTDVLRRFPIIEGIKLVDKALSEDIEEPYFKVFQVFAYINFGLALSILFCIAVWRWGFPFAG